jgi:hypothetical protein
MKVFLADIEQRLVQKENTIYGIINYDIDNSYPQRIKEMIGSSGTASQCADRYSRFIEGEGFQDLAFYKAIVNTGGLTMDKLARKKAVSYALYRGFSVHVNYNALYQPVELTYIPFEDCRLPSDDNEEHEDMIAVYDDWGKRKKRTIKKEDIQWFHKFNPTPEAIQREVDAAGGWEVYGGQIFWYSADGDEYPLSPFDPVLEDVDTDAQIKIFRNNAVRSGFLDHTLFIQKGKFDSESEREAFKSDLTQFQGAKNSSQVMLVEVENDEEIPELKPMTSTEPDKKFEFTNKTTKEAIIEAVGIPSVLINGLVPGKLGTSSEIQDAVAFYNKQTSRERTLLEETATILCKNFYPTINTTNNYAIIEFNIATPVPKVQT